MKTLPPIFFFLLLFFSAFSQTPLFDDAADFQSRAVIVGVSKYQDARITSLDYADKDAEAFAAFLQSKAGGELPPENIKLLTNENATLPNIINEGMDWLREASQTGDRAFIYFSGHGDVERVVPGGMGYLLTYTTPYNSYEGFAISVRKLQDYVNALVSKDVEVILISDACRSGNLSGNAVGGAGLTAEAMERSFEKTAKILSCKPGELSLEGTQWGGGHAVFSYHLVQGLMGLADDNKDNKVTLFELDNYLYNNVRLQVAPKFQTPFAEGNRDAVLAYVDKKTLTQLKKKKEEELPSFSVVATKGLEQTMVVDNAGDAVKSAYTSYSLSLEEGRLLEPKEDCADLYFRQLIENQDIKPIHSTLTRNFAASLWNASIAAFHVYIKSDSVLLAEMFKNDPKFALYPVYLHRASELLGPDHYMYGNLMGAYNYFHGKVKTTEYFETGKPEAVLQEALASQEKSLEYLELAGANYELGIGFMEIKRYERAIEQFKKAAEIAPTWSQPYDGLGSAYRELERYAEARDMYAKALEHSPEELLGPAHRNLGYMLYLTNDFDQAEHHLLEAKKHRPKDPFLYYYLGSLYRDMKRFEDAEAAFLKTIQLDRNFAAAFYYLGLVYQDEERYIDAEQVLLTAIREDPKNASFQYHLAVNHYYQEEFEECAVILEEVLRLDPDLKEAYYYLGNSLSKLGREEEAKEVFRKSAEKAPADAENFYQLGLIQYERGDYAGAETQFLQALALENDHVYSLYYLGMSYWKMKRLEESATQFEKALAFISGNADLHYQLGVVYFDMNKLPQAETALLKTLEINPGYGRAYYALGLTYKKMGRAEEAQAQLDKAKELGVN
jgi:protein O-mannosyl-transferase